MHNCDIHGKCVKHIIWPFLVFRLFSALQWLVISPFVSFITSTLTVSFDSYCLLSFIVDFLLSLPWCFFDINTKRIDNVLWLLYSFNFPGGYGWLLIYFVTFRTSRWPLTSLVFCCFGMMATLHDTTVTLILFGPYSFRTFSSHIPVTWLYESWWLSCSKVGAPRWRFRLRIRTNFLVRSNE